MLYSFIPPVIIVLSLIGIIIFLMKKAPQVALLENRKENGDEEILTEKKGFWGKRFRSENSTGGFRHIFLMFLEKFTRKLRVLFLKLENLFTHWSDNIRRKRRDSLRLENEAVNNKGAESEGTDEFSEDKKIEIFSGEKKQDLGNSIYIRNADEIRRKFWKKDSDEKAVRPIISDKVAVPRIKPEIKNRLERILIERIASNPKDTEAYERLGEYYFEIENYEHSKECFKQVVKLDTMNVNAKDKMRKLERLLTRR